MKAKLRTRANGFTNKGWFKSGSDPRRSNHQLTYVERWSGYVTTWTRYPHLRKWLERKVRFHRGKRERREACREGEFVGNQDQNHESSIPF